jgi:lipoyl synthase
MQAIAEKIENQTLNLRDCGLADYRQVLQLQHQLVQQRRECKIPDTVLIVEHPAVITLGARQSANKLLIDPLELEKKNIVIVETRRGGGITAHNPGQLVFYPILNLSDINLQINEYIRTLEQIGIELLEQLGIESQRKKGFPGLWVNERKIASIGVRISKSITCHGMAINIHNDLSIFDSFVPCGLDGVEITSAQKETSCKYSMQQVKEKLSQLLIKHLSAPDKTIESQIRKLPPWLRRPLPAGQIYEKTKTILGSLNLRTICTSANCPNHGECWNRGTATVLILGNICTRNCKFCSVTSGKPNPPDPAEPDRIAEMAKQLSLKYLVITSVTRDDLPDGGAGHFRDCIIKTRKKCPSINFEILTPDFRNCQTKALGILTDTLPFVFAHNIETVPSLYPIARTGANYQNSLNLLKMAKEFYSNIQTKSSIMLGLGETDNEIEQTLKDLRTVGCDRITIGQYLKPSKTSLEVSQYITPQKFNFWKLKAIQLGFTWVYSLPFARSSYFAEQQNTL